MKIRVALLSILLLLSSQTFADLISRTITINGDMTDWLTSPAIPTNAGQFSSDCQTPAVCELDAPVGSTGRDLESFSFTWDATYIYFYVTRYASTSNTTDWLFYLDEDADGLMQGDERIFRVGWQGSNRNTSASLCLYVPRTGDGDNTSDPITNSGVSDGYDMPGGANNSCTSLYSGVVGGSTTGLQMESRMSWASLGLSGPQNIRFHISSSTGINLPSQVIDNMDGPGGNGGQFFPPDLSVTIATSSTQVSSGNTVTFDVTLTNVLYTAFSNVNISFALPPELTYQSHVAPVGTTFNSPYNTWVVPSLAIAPGGVLVLQVTALAQSVVVPTNTTTTASWVSSTPTDTNVANNSSSANVQIILAPDLVLTKFSSKSSPGAAPGEDIDYRVVVSNTSILGTGNATTVIVEDLLPKFTSFKIGSIIYTNPYTPYSSSGLTVASIEYFNGVTWAYVPVSGGGGAPSGYDRTVQQIRVTFSGTMPPGGGFALDYIVGLN